MHKISVDLSSRSYDILIGKNAINSLGEFLQNKDYSKIVIITDENIEISELGHIKVDKELSPGKTGRVTVQGKDLSENFSEDGAINRAIKKAKIDKKNWDIFKISIFINFAFIIGAKNLFF